MSGETACARLALSSAGWGPGLHFKIHTHIMHINMHTHKAYMCRTHIQLSKIYTYRHTCVDRHTSRVTHAWERGCTVHPHIHACMQAQALSCMQTHCVGIRGMHYCKHAHSWRPAFFFIPANSAPSSSPQ